MAFHAACVSCVPAFYPFSLHKMLSCTFKLPKKCAARPRGEGLFIAKGVEAIFSTSALENRNSNLILDPDPAHTHTRTRKQGRRCKVDFPLRAFALVFVHGRGLWTSAQWKGSVDFRTVPSILVYKMASQTLKWFKFSAARAQIERPFSLQSGGRVEKMVDFCLFSRRLRSLFAPPGSLRSETVAGYPEMPKSRRFEALRANTTSSFFLGRISGPWQSLHMSF